MSRRTTHRGLRFTTRRPLGWVPLVVLAAAALVPVGLSLARAATREHVSRAPGAQQNDPQSEPSRNTPTTPSPSADRGRAPAGDSKPADGEPAARAAPAAGGRQGLIASLTIFVLAIFVGFEVITKVPPTLHTPLMSGSNAISGITIVGAILVSGSASGGAWLGFIAVALAAVNVVGGFLVTHRMLAMFQKKKK